MILNFCFAGTVCVVGKIRDRSFNSAKVRLFNKTSCSPSAMILAAEASTSRRLSAFCCGFVKIGHQNQRRTTCSQIRNIIGGAVAARSYHPQSTTSVSRRMPAARSVPLSHVTNCAAGFVRDSVS